MLRLSTGQTVMAHPARWRVLFMAGDGGFEPPHTESESAVLPLDEPPPAKALYHRKFFVAMEMGFRPNFGILFTQIISVWDETKLLGLFKG